MGKVDVAPVPKGTIIADLDTVVTADIAAELKLHGVRGVWRYLSRTPGQHRGDLSPEEVKTILDAGLGLMAVQHFGLPSRWWPSAELGRARAAAAVTNANACGLLPGVSIAVDVESPARDVTPDEIWAYENAWTRIVRTAEYQSVLYTAQAMPVGITSEDLYIKVAATRYWGSHTNFPAPAYRGWCLKQSLPKRLNTVEVDLNVVYGDALGGFPNWMIMS